MQFNDVLSDIESLIGKQLQSVNPKTAPIYVTKVDRSLKKYFISGDPCSLGEPRSFWELEDIWSELIHKGFSNVDQALFGSGSSRNQPETVFANLPYVQHFKYKDKKHILLRGKPVHGLGTLATLNPTEYQEIVKKIDNYYALSNQAISDTQQQVLSALEQALDKVFKKYPGDTLVQDTEKALAILAQLESKTRNSVVTLNDELIDLSSQQPTKQELKQLNLPIDQLIEDESFTGVENEKEGESGSNRDIPAKIESTEKSSGKIKIRQLTPVLSLIFDRLSFEEIELQPDFQRKDRIWPVAKKAKLIESILMGLPLPVFYFAEKANGDWIVVDGLQRITTVFDFMSGEFELDKLEVLGEEYNGKKFRDLPRGDQRKIREYAITAHLIDLESDKEEMIVELFHRINTYGVKLSDQEIRSAMNKGTSVKFLRYLASSHEFKQATNSKIKPDRQNDMALCLSAISYLTLGYKNFNYKTYDSFLSSAMSNLNSYELTLLNESKLEDGLAVISNNSSQEYIDLERCFKRGLNLASQIFGDFAFKKIIGDDKSPISKPLFEVIVSYFAYVDSKQETLLFSNANEFINMLYQAISLDSDEYADWESKKYTDDGRGFAYALSTSTGKKATVTYRFEAFREILKQSTGIEINLHPLKEKK
ncbi:MULTISPECIES: DUF262 domain-containing protein [Vibrio]|uniref:GmrSD restriction endonucleases N-terminal domain-containing protein n=2 Tax=Vibrio campbellii TaxID=680 RepID=A7MZ05_VIBC1|nr:MULTISPECIES: DUF262 domain-containing protein [Vibrio]ABU70748.1 hypothetical protein VIBHAR_01779 [Vibrio campbellii ATCC BAA-1116]AGU96244.1 hypothetical protein M892_04270 [Vibrio campbellii ATCC BAA-1116]MBT0123943.1 DUF262 domain-containing protein [Vibrio campbellii]MBT0138903.1 DUF262 domain-containing protein [Vibrio campbellii]MBT0143573.1 DUF262 domain-containing protein [Vibrio campbellii]